MCIVIDTNNISRVFKTENAEHANYVPVFDWIVNGRGKIVVGGSTFEKEIIKNRWFIPILTELSRHQKVVRIPNGIIDKLEIEIRNLIPEHIDFDDPHIVALLKASKCRLVCSEDQRAYRYFKSLGIFKAADRPKIYSRLRNEELLADKNVADCCKPYQKLPKKTVEMLQSLISR